MNSETRKLIKRSSREKELKGRFKVEEMSSISTLEFAWEHMEKKSLWPSWWAEREVAKTNKLELLVQEKSVSGMNGRRTAAEQGNLKWLSSVVNECRMSVCISKRSSRDEILTRRSQSALGFS